MSRPNYHSITLIYSPYHVGIPNISVARGPDFLKEEGILKHIQGFGIPVHEIRIPALGAQFHGDIGRSFELFRRTSHLVRKAHEGKSFPIVLAGNCSASVGVAAGLSRATKKLGSDIACVWLDAHADLATTDSLTSGAFDSMPITILAGQCFKAMAQSVPGFTPLDLSRLVYVGLRDVSEFERQRIEEGNLAVIWGSAKTYVDFEGGLSGYLWKMSLEDQPTLVHVDVDCLDVSIGRANHVAAPGGLLRADLIGCLSKVATTTAPMALTIASFDPSLEGAGELAQAIIEGVVAFFQELLRSGRLGDGK